MRSKGRKSASLKWKWGGSLQSVRTSVRMSWMKETAFWDTWRSLWQAACTRQERAERQQEARQGKCGSVASLPWAYAQVLPIFHAHLHQVRRHKAPAAHHVEQGPGFAPHDPQHGIPQAEQVQSAFAILGGLNFSYRKARWESPDSGNSSKDSSTGKSRQWSWIARWFQMAHQGRRELPTQNQKGGHSLGPKPIPDSALCPQRRRHGTAA